MPKSNRRVKPDLINNRKIDLMRSTSITKKKQNIQIGGSFENTIPKHKEIFYQKTKVYKPNSQRNYLYPKDVQNAQTQQNKYKVTDKMNKRRSQNTQARPTVSAFRYHTRNIQYAYPEFDNTYRSNPMRSTNRWKSTPRRSEKVVTDFNKTKIPPKKNSYYEPPSQHATNPLVNKTNGNDLKNNVKWLDVGLAVPSTVDNVMSQQKKNSLDLYADKNNLPTSNFGQRDVQFHSPHNVFAATPHSNNHMNNRVADTNWKRRSNENPTNFHDFHGNTRDNSWTRNSNSRTVASRTNKEPTENQMTNIPEWIDPGQSEQKAQNTEQQNEQGNNEEEGNQEENGIQLA